MERERQKEPAFMRETGGGERGWGRCDRRNNAAAMTASLDERESGEGGGGDRRTDAAAMQAWDWPG